MPRGVDWEKPMHLSIKANTIDNPPLISFERTAEIVETHAGNRRNQPVSQNARNVALDDIILPIFPPARHHVKTLLQPLEHSRNICRIVLTVAIHWDDHIPLSEIEARHHRGGLSRVSLEMDNSNALIGIGQAIKNLR